jgi:hypothetical protein
MEVGRFLFENLTGGKIKAKSLKYLLKDSLNSNQKKGPALKKHFKILGSN